VTTITDEQMRALLPTTKAYTTVILTFGPNRHVEGVDAIIWDEVHSCRSFPGDALPG
jgi:hypothetical protein